MKHQRQRLIGLLAPARRDAERLLTQIHSAAAFEHTRLVTCGLEQGWPGQRFDELHWLGETTDRPLAELAEILHVHFLPGQPQRQHPGARHYSWNSIGELAAFLASLYQARERANLPGLDWRSFADWRPGKCVGRVISGHGTELAAASDALTAALQQHSAAASGQALLIIETTAPMTLGEYVALIEHFTAEISVEVIPAGGCNSQDDLSHLHLLLFMSHIAERADGKP